MDDNAEEEWLENYRRSLLERNQTELEAKRQTIEKFKSHCKELGLKLDDGDFEFIPTIGVVAKHPNILSLLDPEIRRDKEGLVSCEELFSRYEKSVTNPGYLCGEENMVMLNQVFRRGLSSHGNWAPRFVDELWRLDEPEIDAYISLDFDRVRVNVDNSCYFEEDTWYGAPFRKVIRSIPDGSTYLRPPQDLKQEHVAIFFASTYSLEMHWNTKGKLRTFQALEFRNDDIRLERNGAHVHPAKYLHAEYDLEAERFVHFDGAVQYYSETDYLLRRDSDFQKNVSRGDLIKADSEKAFRFNGDVSHEIWTKFTSHFLTGDPLVIEYFSGAYPPNVEEALARMRQHRDGCP